MVTYRIYEDVRYALRLIAGNRTLSLAVFLSLALGIGASTSMFGVVDSLLFRSLPGAVTLLSSYYPARHAARIDPNECLRCE